MSRPPDDEYYNTPNERGILPSRPQRGYAQQPASSNFPSQQNMPPRQAPLSRPGLPVGQESMPQLDFPPTQGSLSQPSLSATQGPFSQPGPNAGQGPLSQSGPSAAQGPFSQPGFVSGQGPARQAGFPSAQGPISRPGLPAGQGLLSRQSSFSPQAANAPQQGAAPGYPQQQPSWPGNFASNQGPASLPGVRTQQDVPPPQWQGQATKPSAPPEEPKKPKPRKGLLTAITIVLVLLLVAGGATALLVLKQKSSAPTASSPKNTHITPGTTQSTGNASSGYGQPTQAGLIWVVTITHVATSNSSEFPPAANDTYLEISLTMKNVSATPQPVSSAIMFTLAGTDGAKYSEALTDTNIQQTPDATVPAGQTLSAQLPYQVPKAKHAFTLSFAYGLINGSNASVSWQINV